LTELEKKDTFEKRAMSKSLLRGIAAVGLLIVLAFGCGVARRLDQTRFGAWAAELDLWDEAIFRWKKVLTQDPRSVAAHNNLAVAYEKKGLWDDAQREYEAALSLDPDNPWVKSNYDRFRNHLGPDQADEGDESKKNEKK